MSAMVESVRAALAARPNPDPRDGAAAALAEHYARLIDADPDRTGELGPRLLAALASLGLTTAGRGATKNGGPGEQRPNPINEIKRQRERRADRAG